jgi:hypothetical protein
LHGVPTCHNLPTYQLPRSRPQIYHVLQKLSFVWGHRGENARPEEPTNGHFEDTLIQISVEGFNQAFQLRGVHTLQVLLSMVPWECHQTHWNAAGLPTWPPACLTHTNVRVGITLLGVTAIEFLIGTRYAQCIQCIQACHTRS